MLGLKLHKKEKKKKQIEPKNKVRWLSLWMTISLLIYPDYTVPITAISSLFMQSNLLNNSILY